MGRICEARQDIPSLYESRPSCIPGYGMGVWTRHRVPRGTALTFDYVALASAKRELHVWEVYKEGRVVEYVDTRDTWIKLIQFARRADEANVEANINSLNTLVFTVMKDLEAGQELLLKFSPSYSKAMGIIEQDLGPVYECGGCPHVFANPLSLTLHTLYHCGTESSVLLWCDECGQIFALLQSLRNHIVEHVAARVAVLPASRPFDTENLLSSPVWRSPCKTSPVWSSPVPCKTSPPFSVNFTTSSPLSPHFTPSLTSRFLLSKQAFFKEKLQEFQEHVWPFRCDQCNKPFSHHSSLKVHQRIHTEGKPFKCDICNKSFARRDSLQAHVRTHTKPFTCGKCGRSFARPDSLSAHARNHAASNHRPFKCVECGKGFGVAQALQTHMRIHTGEKPFKCKHCPKAFAHMSSLKVHINSTHTGIKPFKCQHCSMRFADGSNLRRHIQTHTNEKPHACGLCGKAFARGSILKEHMRTHAKYEDAGQLPNPPLHLSRQETMLQVLEQYSGGFRSSPVSAFTPLVTMTAATNPAIMPLLIKTDENKSSAFSKSLCSAN